MKRAYALLTVITIELAILVYFLVTATPAHAETIIQRGECRGVNLWDGQDEKRDCSMIMSFLHDPLHVLVQFVVTKSNAAPIIGFGGYIHKTGKIDVGTVYRDARVIKSANKSCNYDSTKEGKITQVRCLAWTDKGLTGIWFVNNNSR